jgi:hypothetical protein
LVSTKEGAEETHSQQWGRNSRVVHVVELWKMQPKLTSSSPSNWNIMERFNSIPSFSLILLGCFVRSLDTIPAASQLTLKQKLPKSYHHHWDNDSEGESGGSS